MKALYPFCLSILLLQMASASTIKKDETVVFFPTLGRLSPDGGCVLDIRGWIFEVEKRPGARKLFHRHLGLENEKLTSLEEAALSERTGLFLIDAEHGKRCAVQLGGRRVVLAPSDWSGHFHGEVALNAREFQDLTRLSGDHRRVRFSAALPAGDDRIFTGEAAILEPRGLSIISDIDDTIKVSDVTVRRDLLLNTFLKPFSPVPGMSSLYQKWSQETGASFHYVSASPSQLYPLIATFIQTNGFPRGSFHLRAFAWKRSFFSSGSTSVREHKARVIEPLLQSLPSRHFVFVGDSGELDPEIYGDLARRYRSQIRKVFIREAVPATADPRRYEQAFKDLPGTLWQVFTNAAELDREMLR